MERVLASRIDGNRAYLSREEIHHLVRVRRARPGDRFEAIDGQGRIVLCRLQRADESWYGTIVEEPGVSRESPLKVTLAQALLKKDKFEWVIQKSTELGVGEIIPLVTARTEVILDPRREARKQQRWRRILAEAVKQSGRGTIPRLSPVTELEEVLRARRRGLKLFLDEEGSEPFHGCLSSLSGSVRECLLLVGPEGGWEEKDRKRIRSAGLSPILLGPRILRAETAPIVALSILQYELGDLG